MAGRSAFAIFLTLLPLAAGLPERASQQAQAPPADAPAALAGRVEIVAPAGQPLSQAGSVVWVPGVLAPGDAALTPTMTSRDKRFEPHVVAVRLGATLNFPNVDPIYHNVFSLSPGNAFDLGLYRKGAARSVTFKTAGLVRVYCNIHPEMAGYVLVVDSTLFAVTGADGAYRIAGVPAGRHEVRVWNEMGGEGGALVDLTPGRSTSWNATLDGTKYRRVPHKNKYGKDYPKANQGIDRY